MPIKNGLDFSWHYRYNTYISYNIKVTTRTRTKVIDAKEREAAG
nr:hypothetical protein [Thalassobacillus devorans]